MARHELKEDALVPKDPLTLMYVRVTQAHMLIAMHIGHTMSIQEETCAWIGPCPVNSRRSVPLNNYIIHILVGFSDTIWTCITSMNNHLPV